MKQKFTEEKAMKDNYDFSEGIKNPYTGILKQPITIRLDRRTIAYFKALAKDVGVPYQNLINLFLRDCATQHKRLNLTWA